MLARIADWRTRSRPDEHRMAITSLKTPVSLTTGPVFSKGNLYVVGWLQA
jgi:hypothetical protein